MEKKAVKSAWLIVDLVNDFVTGKFGSEKGIQVAERTAEILEDLEGKITVIFTLDTHVPGDPEFSVWGEHCLIGTDGSRLYPKLKGMKGYSITKRHYDAFLGTDLDLYLRCVQPHIFQVREKSSSLQSTKLLIIICINQDSSTFCQGSN